jgi:hypothetical protein
MNEITANVFEKYMKISIDKENDVNYCSMSITDIPFTY